MTPQTRKPRMSAKARAVLEKLRRAAVGRCIGCRLLKLVRGR